ncbi:helix-turn-helix domain-containing protein [Muricomes intestini]|jgi:AraC-like DNA-binding protein/mannose-6-phosphate isomerase-like protein (cupin superfamily)|uniref:AraC-like DNA-binding protein n=1 Tax=Muricomes intestini TaxID=1796634 RepID=A0A4R3K0L3_9FIRM|nr:helix-turn-helix domain-containing protein [Muricomes intestini]TCS73681.1 AraC-like DNA-binding protein [Muricomes intestini]HAX51429.1 AraC family transcriptional regulator [Lachnospiraceae bacterium]HCR82458.1 AraC family transcriptional regulator [Lachnospiraceae bacterium]
MQEYNKRGYLNSNFRIFHLEDNLSKEFEFHYHDFLKITIFIKGKVQYYIEGKTYDLEPYDIVLVNRNDIHRIRVDNSLPYERIIVYISPGFIQDYKTSEYDLGYCFEKAKKEHSNVLRIPSLEKSSLFKITNRLERSFEDNEYASSLYRQVLFLEFMIHLNRAAMKNRVEFLDTGLYNTKIVNIMQYINSHLTDNLDIDTLAQKFYISKYYMMRLFKAETGYTIGNYITYRRLLLARELISDGQPITQACFSSGFSDYSTFFRAYKSEFSESPRNLLNT